MKLTVLGAWIPCHADWSIRTTDDAGLLYTCRVIAFAWPSSLLAFALAYVCFAGARCAERKMSDGKQLAEQSMYGEFDYDRTRILAVWQRTMTVRDHEDEMPLILTQSNVT